MENTELCKDYNIKEAVYSAEDGISRITMETPYGVFSGYAYVHPDDTKYATRFTGLELAEMRAVRASFVYRIENSDDKEEIIILKKAKRQIDKSIHTYIKLKVNTKWTPTKRTNHNRCRVI